jgi:predicted DNA-binding transcriptional regulator AlpA
MGKSEIKAIERQRQEIERRRLIRFSDLKALGVVTNWPQVRRLVETQNFPPGFYLGPNSRCWFEDEVCQWLGSRPTNRDELKQL